MELDNAYYKCMEFTELTPKSEQLLSEILKSNHSIDWYARFEGLSPAEDNALRSLFKELEDNGMIKVRWADNCPYYIEIFSMGHQYFDIKEKHKHDQKQTHRREWLIAIISAIVGALLGQIPWLEYLSNLF